MMTNLFAKISQIYLLQRSENFVSSCKFMIKTLGISLTH